MSQQGVVTYDGGYENTYNQPARRSEFKDEVFTDIHVNSINIQERSIITSVVPHATNYVFCNRRSFVLSINSSGLAPGAESFIVVKNLYMNEYIQPMVGITRYSGSGTPLVSVSHVNQTIYTENGLLGNSFKIMLSNLHATESLDNSVGLLTIGVVLL